MSASTSVSSSHLHHSRVLTSSSNLPFQAKIRFSEENQAKTALEKVTEASEGGVIKFDEQELKCSVLEGEEWREFRGV